MCIHGIKKRVKVGIINYFKLVLKLYFGKKQILFCVCVFCSFFLDGNATKSQIITGFFRKEVYSFLFLVNKNVLFSGEIFEKKKCVLFLPGVVRQLNNPLPQSYIFVYLKRFTVNCARWKCKRGRGGGIRRVCVYSSL